MAQIKNLNLNRYYRIYQKLQDFNENHSFEYEKYR